MLYCIVLYCSVFYALHPYSLSLTHTHIHTQTHNPSLTPSQVSEFQSAVGVLSAENSAVEARAAKEAKAKEKAKASLASLQAEVSS